MSENKADKKVHNLIGLMQKNLECSICLDLLNNPVSTKCDHPFCNFCITEFLKTNRSVPCPLCKTPVTKRSLRERPQLSKIVDDVRQLVDAFQKDTGNLFSPSRCPQSMEFALGSPDQLPTKEQRGTKRKSNSLERKNVRNVRQSKRRRSDVCEAGDASSESKAETDSSNIVPSVDGDISRTTLYQDNALVQHVQGNSEATVIRRSTGDQKATTSEAAENAVNSKTSKRKKKHNATEELLNYIENGSCGAIDEFEPSADEEEGKSNVEVTEKGTCSNVSVAERKKVPDASPRKADNLFERLSGLSEDGFNEDCRLESGFSLDDIIGDRSIRREGNGGKRDDNGRKSNRKGDASEKGDKKDNELFNTPEEIGAVQKTYSRKCKNAKEVTSKRKVKQWLKSADQVEDEENSGHKKKEGGTVDERDFSKNSEKKDDEEEVYSGNDFMDVESVEKDVAIVGPSIDDNEGSSDPIVHKVPQQKETIFTCTSSVVSMDVNKSKILDEGNKEKRKTDAGLVSHKIFKSTRSDHHVTAECSVTQSKGKLLFKKIKPKKVVDLEDHTKSDQSEAKVQMDGNKASSIMSNKQSSKVRNIFDIDLNSSGQDSDPYEFKSSQKTPVKNTTKKGKGSKIHKEGQIHIEVKKPSEKNCGKSILKKIKQKDDNKEKSGTENNSDVIEIHGDVSENECPKVSKAKIDKKCGNKKGALNFKLTQKDYDDMEQMKDKISEAEDYDLITCSQEVNNQMEAEPVTMATSSTCQGEEPNTSSVKIGISGKNAGKEARKKLVSFHEEVILIGEECDTAPLNNNNNGGRCVTGRTQGKKDNSCKTDAVSCQGDTMDSEHSDLAVDKIMVPESVPNELEDDLPCSGTSSATDDLDIAPNMDDFEEPNLEIQPVEVIEKLNSQESEDPIPKSHDNHVTNPLESVVEKSRNRGKLLDSQNTRSDSHNEDQHQAFQSMKSLKNGKKLSLSKPMIQETAVQDSDIVPETPMMSNFPNEGIMIRTTRGENSKKTNKIESKEMNDEGFEQPLNVAEVDGNTTAEAVCERELAEEDVVADTCETQMNHCSINAISTDIDTESVIKSSGDISISKRKSCALSRTKLKSNSSIKNLSMKKNIPEKYVEKSLDKTDSEEFVKSSVQEPAGGTDTEIVSTQKSESVVNCTQISTQDSVSLLRPQKLYSPSIDSITNSVTDVSDHIMVEPSEEPVLKKPKRKCFSLSKSPNHAEIKKGNSSESDVIEKDGIDREVITLSGGSGCNIRESEIMQKTKTTKRNKLKRMKTNKKQSPGSSDSREEIHIDKYDDEIVKSSRSNSTSASEADDDVQTGSNVVVMETVDSADVNIDDVRQVNCDTSEHVEGIEAVPETIETEVVMNSGKQDLNDVDTCMEDDSEVEKGEVGKNYTENQNKTNGMIENRAKNDFPEKVQNVDDMQKERQEGVCDVENVRSMTSQEELTSTLLSNRTIRKCEKLEKSRLDSQDELPSTLLSNRTVRQREKLERSRQESPDDIFMMDSEYPEGGTESEVMVEQNQEGMLDLLAIDSDSERVSQASQRYAEGEGKNLEREEGTSNSTGSREKENLLQKEPTEGGSEKIETNLVGNSENDIMCSEDDVNRIGTCSDIVAPSVTSDSVLAKGSQKTPVKRKSGGRKIKRGLAAKFFKELNLSQPNKETVSEDENIPALQKTAPRDASPTFDISPHKGSLNVSQRVLSQTCKRQNEVTDTSDQSGQSADENEEDLNEVEQAEENKNVVVDFDEEVEERGEDVMDFEEEENPTLGTEVDIIPDSVQDEVEVGRTPKKFITMAKRVSPKVFPFTKNHLSNSREVVDIGDECSPKHKQIIQVNAEEGECSKRRKWKDGTKKRKLKSKVRMTTGSPSSSPLPDVFGTSRNNSSQAESCDSNNDDGDDIEDDDDEDDDPVLIKRNSSDFDDMRCLDEDDSDSTQMPHSVKLTGDGGTKERQKGEINSRIEEEDGHNDDMLDDSKDDRSEDDSSDFVLHSGKEEEDVEPDDLQNNESDDDDDDVVSSKRKKSGRRILGSDDDDDDNSVIEVDERNDNMIDDDEEEELDDDADVLIVDDDAKQTKNDKEVISVDNCESENFEERQFNTEERKDGDEDENEDESDDDDDDVVVVKKTKSQVIDDSESDVTNCSQETSSDRQGNLTSSSAFSSQSDILSTEDQAKLAENLESMRREIARVEANLAAARLNLSHGEKSGSKASGSKEKSNANISRESIDQVEVCAETPMKVNETVIVEGEEEEEKIADYHSEGDSSDDLFLSPPPPTPPPSDEEQGQVVLDLPESVKEADRFLQQFRSDRKVSSKPSEKDAPTCISSTPSKPLSQDAVKSSTPSHVYHSTPKNGKVMSPFSSQNKARVISPLTQNYKRSPLQFVSSQRRSGSIALSENNQRFPSPLLTKRGLSQGVSERIPLSPLVINSSQSQPAQEKQPSRVFAATSLLLPQMRELQKLLQEQGCQFSPKFTDDVTHLIVKTDPQGCRVCERTLKFFQAVSRGCWVLDYQYIQDCRAAGRILPEERYEILGDTVTGDRHFGPRKSRQSKERDLFEDFQFIVIGDSRGLQQDDLKSLITECGGSVGSHPDQIPSDYHRLVVTCTDIDGDDEDTETRSSQEFKVINRLYRLHHMITVSREWVLDSLTLYEVQPIQEYVLTNVKGMILPKF